MQHKLFFTPWISENYRNNSSKFGRLLIIAESHYGIKDSNENTTINVLQDVVDNDRSAGYRMFTIMGHTINPEDRNELWNNCAFSNLIQDSLIKPRENPARELLSNIHENFFQILDEVKPKKIIVTSSRAWKHWLPEVNLNEIHRCEHLIDQKVITENPDIYSYLWRYHYNGGSCLAIGTNHPSSIGFADWTPLIQKFVHEY